MKNFFEFYHGINETMNVMVKDANYEEAVQDLNDLSFYLSGKIINPLISKANEEQKEFFKKNRHPEIIAVDGTDWDKTSGVLNVYLQSIHSDLRETLKKYLKYYLQELDVKFDPNFVQNKSNMHGSDTFRIKIFDLPNRNNNRPPEVNMSNANAAYIFRNILGFRDFDWGFTVSVRELLLKINMYPNFKAKQDATEPTRNGNFVDFGISEKYILDKLNQIKQLTSWAIKNDYDFIEVT